MALEQIRMGIVRMRRPMRVSALESDCLGLNPNHDESLTLSGLDFLVCKMGIIIVHPHHHHWVL